VSGQWFSPGTPVSLTNTTDRNDITEILLQVALKTLTPHLKAHNICRNYDNNHLITTSKN
jgi:hypothetical protein